MTYSGIPIETAGPYNQTLFLGCSVTNFNCSLAWGAEQSTITVRLVEDTCFHPESAEYTEYDTKANTILQQVESPASPPGKAFTPPYSGLYNTDDPQFTVQKNIIHQLKDMEDDRDQMNNKMGSQSPNAAPSACFFDPVTLDNKCVTATGWKDDGKLCWDSGRNRVAWKDRDPGFLGFSNAFNSSGYDILGVPARFKFHEFEYAGMISSWRQNANQGGIRTFEVEIKNFANLLNGCQLIIDHYAGAVCGVVSGTNNPINRINKDLAMPMPYSASTGTNGVVNMVNYPYTGTIYQGNIPNVFNIYGFLENKGYYLKDANLNPAPQWFGYAGVNDEGMRASFIYDALYNMLHPTGHSVQSTGNIFSPYGCIIARAPRVNSDTSRPQGGTFNFSVVPQNIKIGQQPQINLTHMGLLPTYNSTDNVDRSLLKLDLTQIPRPPNWFRIKGPIISIMDFITQICDSMGFDFFIDFIPNISSAKYTGTIVVRTVSRRTQPNKNQIQKLISRIVNKGLSTGQNGAVEATIGKEFNDANTRTMYIGGKQRRLFQFKNLRLAFKQNTLIYNPFANGGAGAVIDAQLWPYGSSPDAGLPNQIRIPDPRSTRTYKRKILRGAAVVDGGDGVFTEDTGFVTPNVHSMTIKKGNYLPAGNITGPDSPFEVTATPPITTPNPWPTHALPNLEIYKDVICPYFGIGSDGLARKVFYDKYMNQMQIIFPVSDIAGLFSIPLNPSILSSQYFVVLENELRAAGGSFESWITYCFTNIFTTDISQIMYKAFRTFYGGIWGIKDTVNNQPVSGPFIKSILDQNNKNIGADESFAGGDLLRKDLQNVHAFFQDIANTYYGKQFMIRVPEPPVSWGWYRDADTGQVFSSYEPAKEGAWEEPGNFIDDTIRVGGADYLHLSNNNGTIPCLLGYNASYENEHVRGYKTTAAINSSLSTDLVSITANAPDAIQNLAGTLYGHTGVFCSINHTFPGSDYVLVNYTGSMPKNPDAYGESLPTGLRYRLYTKAEIADDMVFLESNFKEPRYVVTIGSPVTLGQYKNPTEWEQDTMVQQDGLLRLYKGASVPQALLGVASAAKDGLLRGYTTVHGGFQANSGIMGGNWSAAYARKSFTDKQEIIIKFSIAPPGAESNSILQKAAIPMFCGLPLQLNQYVYGPWINHPGLIASDIFPHVVSTDTDKLKSEIENLIGGVKVNVDSELTPWNFGGMAALDDAAILTLTDEVNYQQTIENGTVKFPGFDNYRLGDILQMFGGLFNGPVLNNILVDINENGITTTYSFRTYLRKLGLFNKETAERIKALSLESLKRNKEISAKIRSLRG